MSECLGVWVSARRQQAGLLLLERREAEDDIRRFRGFRIQAEFPSYSPREHERRAYFADRPMQNFRVSFGNAFECRTKRDMGNGNTLSRREVQSQPAVDGDACR